MCSLVVSSRGLRMLLLDLGRDTLHKIEIAGCISDAYFGVRLTEDQWVKVAKCATGEILRERYK